MNRTGRTSFPIAAGALLSVALVACDGSGPIGVHDPQQATFHTQQCVEVEIEAVYSGPPNTDPGVIDINHQFVYVEILDVESYIPRPIAVADDVRIGDDWETGTPAESFQLLDVDQDGNRDIRLTYSKSRLVADGNLDLQTTVIGVWGLDRQEDPEVTYCGSYAVEVLQPPPPAGTDVVVFNDVNPFDIGAMGQPTDNTVMVQNLVSFTSEGPRNDGEVVWWDCGRSSAYPGACTPGGTMTLAHGTIEGEGLTLNFITSSSGTLVDIPVDVKSIWLWTPMVEYTVAEINALKQFAAEGGRIVFIGEHEGFYGGGIPIQNDFLQKMGAVMRNIGEAVDCGYTYLPPESIVNEHQVMDEVDDLTIGCASVIEPGPQDFVLFYDTSRTRVLAGVARIDTTPLAAGTRFPQQAAPRTPLPAGLNPNSTTGR